MHRVAKDIKTNTNVKWVNPTNLHVTLKFLGDIDREDVSNIRGAAERTVQDIPDFELQVDKLGAFPNKSYPKVIWLGTTQAPEEIFQLQSKLERELEPLGFEPEDRDYVPHTTLGRTKDDRNQKIKTLGEEISSYQLEDSWKVSVETLTFMESKLKPTGPVYSQVFDLAFGS